MANNTNKILFAKLVHSLLLISDFIAGLLHIIRKSSFNLKDKDGKYIGFSRIRQFVSSCDGGTGGGQSTKAVLWS